ncbi:MAG TPA: OmpA family protein [Labilithrix sp.]|jgi:peptidoglycan-associated lipoprotein|nr:OmpA family protein [Labilithrix sp.]
MKLRYLAVSAIGVLATSTLMACAKRSATAPPTPTVPTITSSAVHPAGESLAVAEEIAHLCKLALPDPRSAPKYEFDRSDLLPGDRATLSKLAECLTTGPLMGRALQLIGRADAQGESNYNMALGAQRAGGVADYLAHLGVARGRMSVTSRGELDAVGIDEAGRQVDRRVDIVLAKQK